MASTNIEISEDELSEILAVVSNTYGYEFKDYSQASMLRRVQRFMEDEGFKKSYDLKFALLNQKSVFDQFLKKVTVNVTEMFRDPEFYKTIKEKVLPVLASYPIIKIWHAGCSTGEEVFSMSILLHEAAIFTTQSCNGPGV